MSIFVNTIGIDKLIFWRAFGIDQMLKKLFCKMRNTYMMTSCILNYSAFC